MSDLKINKNDVSRRFKWKTRDDEFIDPSSMETRHLFYTLRMIWNHSMPREVMIEPFHFYTFSAFYTEDYMKKAIYFIGRELMTRSDIKPLWKSQLDYMASKFNMAQNEFLQANPIPGRLLIIAGK